MSRISNDLAGQIATKLTEKSRLNADKLHVEFRELVTSLYEEQTPASVKKCFKENADWFYRKSSIKLDGHGFNWEYVSTTRPVICNNNSDAILKLTSSVADKITSAQRKWQKAKNQYDNLKKEAKQALLTLKTYNNIRKELPEAASMLPPPLSNALVVNFTSLKQQLAKQPEIKKEVTVS